MTAADLFPSPPPAAVARQTLRRIIAERPGAYRIINTLRGDTAGMATRNTDLVIEGYPRCGNSFAEAALELVRPDLKLGHHRHAPAQLLFAAKEGLPAVMLMRDPLDAVVSVLARRPGSTSPIQAFKDYESFYSAVEPVAHQVLVSDFDVTTAQISRLLEAIEDRFSLGLDLELVRTATFPDLVMAQVNAISAARKAGERVNYGIHLSDEERAARRARQAELRSAIEERFPGAVTSARAVYDRVRRFSL